MSLFVVTAEIVKVQIVLFARPAGGRGKIIPSSTCSKCIQIYCTIIGGTWSIGEAK